MIQFNSNGLVVGLIKQILETFNLPKCKVYKQNQEHYFKDALYIKNNSLCRCINDNEFKYITPYKYNKSITNYTRTLPIKNNVYDTETHEYLGEYLRFLRDYKNLNLMSLYNCFSNRIITDLKINDPVNNISFDSDNSKYKIYGIPVKLGSSYSIHIDSSVPFEILCGFYGDHSYLSSEHKHNDTGSSDASSHKIESNTYVKINNCRFADGYNFNRLKDIVNECPEYCDDLIKHEDDLKLFIKLPFENTSSIVIFEDVNNVHVASKDIKGQGYLCINDASSKDPIFITKSQMLQINSGTSYPFSDRLLEYLSGNAITNICDISDNIRRLQRSLSNIYKETEGKEGIKEYAFDGIWEDTYRYAIYKYAKKYNLIETTCDILGYVDKDIEKILGEDPDLYEDDWYMGD